MYSDRRYYTKRLTSPNVSSIALFISSEDRVVKKLFASLVKEGHARLVLKKPLPPSRDEVRENPRSRSAKLRCIEKI